MMQMFISTHVFLFGYYMEGDNSGGEAALYSCK